MPVVSAPATCTRSTRRGKRGSSQASTRSELRSSRKAWGSVAAASEFDVADEVHGRLLCAVPGRVRRAAPAARQHGGAAPPAIIEETDRTTWSRIVDVSLSGTSSASRSQRPPYAGRPGAIVTIASTMGLAGTAQYAPDVASKWAVRNLRQTAALQLGRDHIRVNTNRPGVVGTGFVEATSSRRRARYRRFFAHPRRSSSRGGGAGGRDGAAAVPRGVRCLVRHQLGMRDRRCSAPLFGPAARENRACQHRAASTLVRGRKRCSTCPMTSDEPWHRTGRGYPRANRRHQHLGAPHRTSASYRDLHLPGCWCSHLCACACATQMHWHAICFVNRCFTFHLEVGVRADVPAQATPVTDPAEPQAVVAEIVADPIDFTIPAPSDRLDSQTGREVG